jgi:hypothetical protein
MPFDEIEVPADAPALNQAVDAAGRGTVTYLTRQGRRVAAIVPSLLAEAVLFEPSAGEADNPRLSVEEARRRLEQLARVQGVYPVGDPAELRGPDMPDDEFEAFHSAAMTDRPDDELHNGP